MKKFKGMHPFAELLKECRRRKFATNTALLDRGSSDYFQVNFTTGGVSGYMLVSALNGRFFGELSDGKDFTSDSTKYESLVWFNDLLETVYE